MNHNQFLPILGIFAFILQHYMGQSYHEGTQVTITFQAQWTWLGSTHPYEIQPSSFDSEKNCICAPSVLHCLGLAEFSIGQNTIVSLWRGDKWLLLFKIITMLGKLTLLWYDLFTPNKALCLLTLTDPYWIPSPLGHCSGRLSEMP